jgi:NADP-dependent aldehyde dehydrogenase
MELHGKNLVAGKLSTASGKPFRAFDLAKDTSLAPDFYEATKDDSAAALEAAHLAFHTYRSATAEVRAGFLEKIAAEIEALGDSLLQRCHEESALPLARLQGERARTCGQLRLFAETVREGSWVDARIDTALPDRKPLARPDLRRVLQPLGVVVVFGASNFPLAFSVAGGDTASAFAAGCPVVVKAHPAHPGTSELIGSAIARAVVACGLPEGMFSLLHGGPDLSISLVKHPLVSAVGFTGSHGAGRALFDAAAARPNPIPVFSEMSSVNPLVILPGALRERAKALAEGLLGSFTLGVGQFCTKPGLIFVRNSPEATEFIHHFSASVQAAPRGVMLTPGIRGAFEEKKKKLLASPDLDQIGAAAIKLEVGKTETVAFAASVTAAHFLRSPELAHETFGPFVLVIQANSDDELHACIRSLEGQLTATLHGTPEDLMAAQPLVSLLEQRVGRILINGFPTGVEVSPAMHHGGPYPATTDARFTSVGTAAILRFARPICYQNFPAALLPAALRSENPLGILRLVNGRYVRDAIV